MLFLLESCLPYVPSQILFILPFLTSLLFDLLPKWNSLDGQTYLCRKQSSMSCATNCCSAVSWVHDHLHNPSDFLTSMSVHPWHGVNPSCCPNTVVSSLLILALQCTSKCSPSHVFSLQIPISLNPTKKKSICLCLGSLPILTLPFISLLSHLVSPPFFSLLYFSKTLLWSNCTRSSIILTISTISSTSYLISKFPFSSWRSKASPASSPLMSIWHISALISSYSQSVCFIDLALVIKEGVIFTSR